MQARYGEWVIDAHLPDPGTPTQPVEAGYMANAYVRMKHPDYDVLRGMLNDVGESDHRPRRLTRRSANRSMNVTLLGPQRRTVAARAAVRELMPDGPIATINAGWQERESETAELDDVLGGRMRNLAALPRGGRS